MAKAVVDCAKRVPAKIGDALPIDEVGGAGQTGRGVASSVDVELVEGERYLVALRGDEPRTDLCSVLEVQDDQLHRLRPANSRAPVAGSNSGSEPRTVPVALVGVGGTFARALRSRRRRGAPR